MSAVIDAESWEVSMMDTPADAKFTWNRKVRRFLYHKKTQLSDFLTRHKRMITTIALVIAAVFAYIIAYYTFLVGAFVLLAHGLVFLYLLWYVFFIVFSTIGVYMAVTYIFSYWEKTDPKRERYLRFV